MTSNKTPFWESNLNPVTMFITSTRQISRESNNSLLRKRYATIDELHEYISGKELMKEFKIGAKKVKSLFAILNEQPRYNNGISYYRIEYLDKVREMVSITVAKKADMDQYITNQELMKIFNFNQYKAWEIATKEKLIKFKFSGNVAYYKREQAIAVFAKYKKQ